MALTTRLVVALVCLAGAVAVATWLVVGAHDQRGVLLWCIAGAGLSGTAAWLSRRA